MRETIKSSMQRIKRFALPALGQVAERRPTGKMLRRRKMLENAADSPASGAPRKNGAHFTRQKPSIGCEKYTLKRQNEKPYKAVEVCQDIPEVHRGYRFN